MKSILLFSAIGLLLPSGAAFADDELYKTKNCFACHRIDRTTLGPSFRNIAAKYVDDKGADVKLANKIREGGCRCLGSGSDASASPGHGGRGIDACALDSGTQVNLSRMRLNP